MLCQKCGNRMKTDLHVSEWKCTSCSPESSCSLPMLTFDAGGDPTDDYLNAIEEAEHKDVIKLAEAAWNKNMGAITRSKDEDGDTIVRFATGGWSSNEMIIRAMDRNRLFMAVRWISSHRGGCHRFFEESRPV